MNTLLISVNREINFIDSYSFVGAVKIYQFKANDSEVNAYLLCLGSNSNDFTVVNMKKQDYMCICMIFHLIMIVLILMIF